jgi:class III cytochrome C family protein
MTKRWLAFCIIGCLGVWCFSECGKIGPPAGGRVLSVSMANIPKRMLKRPPVRFDHDLHSVALESDGCGVCHKTDDSRNLLFSFLTDWDETKPRLLEDSFHERCVGCHTERTKQGKESGPVTCGECHVIQREHPSKAYEPVLPEYYDAARDIYHTDCTACHREPAKHAEHAGALDWQKFYVAQKEEAEADWPEIVFDYFLHDKHSEALMGQCFDCHDISQARWQELMSQGIVPSAQDLGMDVEETSGLSHRQAAHARCINCHLKTTAQQQKAGPVQCDGCHSGVERTAEEFDVPRPICKREARILIQLEEGANLAAVAFDHESHVASSRACQDCHHKTLRPCQDCHTVEGIEEGGWVTLAEAHHDVSSSYSCVGCHEAEKKKADCAGCHRNMPRGLLLSTCTGCHNGSLESLDKVVNLPAPEELIPDDVKDEMEIAKIEREYGPSPFPHLEIAQELTRISNESTLARHFHTDKMTICKGCHHLAPLDGKTGIPPCGTCHTARDEPTSGTPTLLGAYHQQCLGCHEQMDPSGRDLPQDCTGCHKEKTPSENILAAHMQD